MKKENVFLVIILLAVMAGCGGKQSTDDLITVNVTKSYPKKELILQDFLDVEYIPLETTDDFITRADINAIGKEIMLFRGGFDVNDLFIYDKNGKGLSKINRRGQGPEEHVQMIGLTALDEDNNEIYVNDMRVGKIIVYDLFGNFKRILRAKEGFFYTQIDVFDQNYLICLDNTVYFNEDRSVDTNTKRARCYIVSKQDGSVIKEIDIPYTAKKIATLFLENNARVPVRDRHTIPYRDSWLIVEPSSDTIYRYLPDHSMIPFIVRTPSIQSMDPSVFLYPGVLTDRYFFMRTIKTEMFDWQNDPWPGINLVYDRQEKSIFETVLYNDDFTTKVPVSMCNQCNRETTTHLANSEDIVFALKLEVYELMEAYKEGKLKGKLKEIAAKLDPEDNPVLMIAKNKK